MTTNTKYILARVVIIAVGAALAVLLIRLGWYF